MPMLPFRGQWPRLGDRVFIANGAQVVGDVTIGGHDEYLVQRRPARRHGRDQRRRRL